MRCSYAYTLDCDGNCGACPRQNYCPCVNPAKVRTKNARAEPTSRRAPHGDGGWTELRTRRCGWRASWPIRRCAFDLPAKESELAELTDAQPPIPTSGTTRTPRRHCCAAPTSCARRSPPGRTWRRAPTAWPRSRSWPQADADGGRRAGRRPAARPGHAQRRLGADGVAAPPVGAIRRAAGDRIGPCRSRRHRERRTGPRCCCACTCAGPSATRYQDRDPRPDRGRGGGAQERHLRDRRPMGLRPAEERARRASAGADQPVRLAEAAPHQLRAGGGDARGRRGRGDRDPTRTTCGSTPIGPAAPAASTSTRPTRPCASPTCRPGSWSPARTSAARSRTGSGR